MSKSAVVIEKRNIKKQKYLQAFVFKCKLTAHLKNHSETQICGMCYSIFRKAFLFDQYHLSCIDLNDEQFIPSFLTTDNFNVQAVASNQIVQIDNDMSDLDNQFISHFFEL